MRSEPYSDEELLTIRKAVEEVIGTLITTIASEEDHGEQIVKIGVGPRAAERVNLPDRVGTAKIDYRIVGRQELQNIPR